MLKVLLAGIAAGLMAGCGGMPGLAPAHAADFNACQSSVDADPKADSFRRRLDAIDTCMAKKGWKPTAACRYQENEGTKFCEYAR